MRYLWNIFKEQISLTNLVIVLIAIMTIVVVCDRINFHNYVYKNVHSCIDLSNEKQKNQIYPQSCINCVTNTDTIFENNPESNKTAKHKICVFNNIHNCDKKTSIENARLEALEKSDGLIGANGLTYLITLIIALLATLSVNSIDKTAKLLNKIREERYNIEEKAHALEEKAHALEEKAHALKERSNSYYKHITKFDFVLTRIESIYNLSIIMGNVILSLPSAGKDKIQDTLLQQIGMFLYRMSKMCKQIEAQFNNQITIDYMTPEEKNIISTFIEDALNELDRNKNYAETDLQIPKLSFMIENVMDSINEITERLNEIEIKTES